MSEIKDEIPTDIQNFYKDKTILITGGSGFLGKSIVEKILRSCSSFKKIFLLIRMKKDKDIDIRMKEFVNSEIFSLVKKENPDIFKRIVPIQSDLSLPRLNLSDQDYNLIIQETNIIFHSGANVRFTDPLKFTTITNVTATEELLKIANQLHHLESFLHISSLFSNCNRTDFKIEDRLYESPMNYKELQTLIKVLPEDSLDQITPKLLGNFPNTYSFSKNIAENCVKEMGTDLPVAIFRPSLINSIYQEPIPGYNSSLYGLMGIVAGYVMGLLHVAILDLDNLNLTFIPVDFCANLSLVIAYQTYKEHKKNKKEILVYNYDGSRKANEVKLREFVEKCLKFYELRPSIKTIWKNFMFFTTNITVYYILHIFLHLIPGLFIDVVLFMKGKRTRAIKLYNTFNKFNIAYKFFFTTNFDVENKNQENLWESLSEEDKKIFNFNIKELDYDVYIKNLENGIYNYYLKEDKSLVEKAKKRYKKLQIIHYTFVSIMVLIFSTIIWCFFSFLFY